MKHDVNEHLAKNLKRIREERNLTQEQMSKLIGYSIYGYRKLEQGSRGLPIHRAMEVAKKLGCSLNEIFLP